MLEDFFEPKSVAVIGASRTPGKAGNILIANLIANSYEGEIYPVNPNISEVMGYRACASVLEIQPAPDAAIIVVPAAATLAAVQDCVKKGVKALIIETAGFSELMNDQGREYQAKIIEAIRGSKTRVIGPNTTGLVSTPGKFNAAFYPLGKVRQGPVAYVAQTGSFGAHTLRWIMSAENFGVSRVIGLGNQIDVNFADALEYLGNDPETKVICMYVETIGLDKTRFAETIRAVTAKKPVIALKGAVNWSGIKAAVLHTASVNTPDPEVFDPVFTSAGPARVSRYQDLIDSAKALAFQSLPKGNRVAVMVPSGGMGVIAADCLEEQGMAIAQLSDATLATLQSMSQSWITISNPIDIWSAAIQNGFEKGLRAAMDAVLEDRNVDALVHVIHLLDDEPMPDLSFIPELSKRYPDKPILVAVSSGKERFEEAKKFLEERSIPVYLPVEGACEALGTMYRCSRLIRAETI